MGSLSLFLKMGYFSAYVVRGHTTASQYKDTKYVQQQSFKGFSFCKVAQVGWKECWVFIGWRWEKWRGAGSGAPFFLNRDLDSSCFHDLPSFETFLQSQTEQARSLSHEPAFCRLKMASERPGQADGRQKGSALGRGPHEDSRRGGNGLLYCMQPKSVNWAEACICCAIPQCMFHQGRFDCSVKPDGNLH